MVSVFTVYVKNIVHIFDKYIYDSSIINFIIYLKYINMFNNIFSLIFGILIKILDDHYDMNIYDKKYINFIKILIIVCIIYWSSIDLHYPFGFLLMAILCYLTNGVDNKFYVYSIYLFGTMLLLQLFFNKNNVFTKDMVICSIISTLFSFGGVFLEARLYTEEYSFNKIIARIFMIIIFGLLYKLDLSKLNQLLDIKIFSENNIVNKILNCTNDKIFNNTYSLLIGYCLMSVINMSYMCSKN